MTLVNNGASADRQVGATTPLADKVQFHKETEHNGVSHMSQMQSIDIQPGAKIVFKPGEMHMMIVGLKQQLAQGQTFPLTLQFKNAGKVEVTVPIQGGRHAARRHGSDDAWVRDHGAGAVNNRSKSESNDKVSVMNAKKRRNLWVVVPYLASVLDASTQRDIIAYFETTDRSRSQQR